MNLDIVYSDFIYFLYSGMIYVLQLLYCIELCYDTIMMV